MEIHLLLHNNTPFTFTNQTFRFYSSSRRRTNSLRYKLIFKQQHQILAKAKEEFKQLDTSTVKLSVEEDGSNNVEEEIQVLSKSEMTTFEKLGNQYKKDLEFWGNGCCPIFTIFQDIDGNFKHVSVSEDEIVKRSNVQGEEDFKGVEIKIARAKCLAREIEIGEYKIPKDSLLARFVVLEEKSRFMGFVEGVRSVVFHQDKCSRIGLAVFLGCFVLWSVEKKFKPSGTGDMAKLTEIEKEMLRRKIRSRTKKDKEKLEKGGVEVIEDVVESIMASVERPQLDKQELLNIISQAKANRDESVMSSPSIKLNGKSKDDFNDKIREIQQMARHAREVEQRNRSVKEKGASEKEGEQEEEKEVKDEDQELLNEMVNAEVHLFSKGKVEEKHEEIYIKPSHEMVDTKSYEQQNFLVEGKVKEEHEKLDKDFSYELEDAVDRDSIDLSLNTHSEINSGNLVAINSTTQSLFDQSQTREIVSQDPSLSVSNRSVVNGAVDDSEIMKISGIEHMNKEIQDCDNPSNDIHFSGKISSEMDPIAACPVQGKEFFPNNHDNGQLEYKELNGDEAAEPFANKESWMEQNFQELEPIVKKIRSGFSDNYLVAKEKEEDELCSDISQLKTGEDDGELDWMKDDGLREIVFQVRENELMGRDPFYMMDTEDKRAFFEGLERKVDSTNTKLASLHEYIHSKVENLDYGADGISVYDSPEKFVPRWKGPPVDKDPDFLNNLRQRKINFFDEMGISQDIQESAKKSVQSPVGEDNSSSPAIHTQTSGTRASSKATTIIEGSDGSTKVGNKSGKEFWQHTKKWSQGFLDSYNAETDPDIKSTMKDMGKDLNRWISEKEIEETADLMTKIPKKKREYIEKKLDKLKKDMETYGPQAVVSKYREYGEEKEEDYLWWLDLPHVLCIELYTSANGADEVGFYSLEMATDLDLDPKPYHVIAFEDPGDCKNLCYIIQAHMETLGNGNAFVIARPPKDTFREAKANGFNVTVIKKAQLQLNVDQTLEEVEEKITEIGSKMYHDKFDHERSVDMGALMKGVFGAKTSPKRTRSKQPKKLSAFLEH